MNKQFVALIAIAAAIVQPAWADQAERKEAVVATPGGCDAAWPETAIANHESGTVEMMVLIKANGRASDIKIVKSSKSRDLDKAAVTAAAKCTYVPATFYGEPQESWFFLKRDWIPAAGTDEPAGK